MGMHPRDDHDTIASIISEFTEVMAFSRTRWTRFAEEVHPGLSGANMVVLQFVRRKGPITATGLSQMLDMDKSLVSRQITKLRDLGFVVTTEAAEDRRVQLLTVSEEAEALLNHVRELWSESYRERFADWTPEQLTGLHEGLHRFNVSTGELRQDGPAVRCAKHANETEETPSQASAAQ